MCLTLYFCINSKNSSVWDHLNFPLPFACEFPVHMSVALPPVFAPPTPNISPFSQHQQVKRLKSYPNPYMECSAG